MNPKQKLFHQRLVIYLKKNGLDEKSAIAAADESIQTLVKQGDAFRINNVPKMGKYLLKERKAYEEMQNAINEEETFFDTGLGRFFKRR